jgi:mannose-6-phosphate isomerase
MLYPFKFKPIFKDYIWGGRNLEQFGKKLPVGIVAESWEISCHPNGVSVVSNGELAGITLSDLLGKFGRQIVGAALPDKYIARFPLLVKLIDANDKLSVQVHPDDRFACANENGESGKNEMWHILSAKPGAKLIYDVLPGTTEATFVKALNDNRITECLHSVEVFPGDTINIPAGLIHAIGEGIVLAEIQQNSDITYRIFDYNRVDKNGRLRPLHLEKARKVIDFNSTGRQAKVVGLTIEVNAGFSIKYLVANPYFAVELLSINGAIMQEAEGSRFYIYFLTGGAGTLKFNKGTIRLTKGESLLIPAALGKYYLEGNFTALKAYVPNLTQDVVVPLKNAGFGEPEIYSKVSGLKDCLDSGI